MKALSIIALIFSALSIFIPVMGIYIAIICSIFALITFCKEPTISGITFGINIISTAFLSPTLALTAGLYIFFVGFHIVLMLIAFIILFVLKRKK
ncbi:hypothetical protein B5800_03315 [Gilliamella apicola]|nr:hypothetical protein B5800_03315 [Gilliamella apicola]ORF46897.1 hypothetical protein B5803_12835 [Gilliamella apicola]ORF49375.1 hypothetical protein B5802_13120 [Gilliamella apicola]ORF55563.1 hypothetical protein B5798_02920 [Gilliamella apicola]ORF57772.1 hypothetical protein B5804_12895 [Gilliamella apicola]